MLPSESISKIIKEYNNILVRDLGFSDWGDWEPIITKIMDILGIDSLGCLNLTTAEKNPGKRITEALIRRWTSKRGDLWDKLIRVEETTGYTPYEDYQEYTIRLITPEEIISKMTGPEVYRNYEKIQDIKKSEDYKILRKLHGLHITIQR